jgi:formate hydrogenlyase subunit 3/multisubunit Na+/H+ antiporter MnhD subunit
MNEQKIKEILERSRLETSSDFTEKLIYRIETKKSEGTSIVWSFPTILTVVTLILFCVSFLLYQSLNSRGFFFGINRNELKTPFFLIFSILFLLVINYIMKLNETHKQRKNELGIS